ncbi:MAG TPA: TIGR03013 family XrtA/PEP-CTERM system glycosyltransferase [Rudaea sp.]
MFLIVAVDAVLLIASASIAAHLRYFSDAAAYTAFADRFLERGLLFSGAMLVCMCALGLYQPQTRETAMATFARQAVAFTLGTLLLPVLYYLIPQAYIGRGVFALTLLTGLAAVAIWRTIATRLMEHEGLKRRILILGAGQRAAFIAQRLRNRSDRETFSIVGFVPVAGEPVMVPMAQMVTVHSSLDAWAGSRHIDEIVVVPDDRRGTLPMDELLECRQRGIMVTDPVRFMERESGKVKLTTPPSWLIFSGGFDGSPLRKLSKRAFDIGSASLILALSWPLMLLVALAIRIESGAEAPILYSQERVGERGSVFRLFKFRSMRVDAEAGGVAQWARQNDQRVTRVGRVIRKLRLDELPQLWNVLNGSMSLIGPRPERPQFVDELSRTIPYYSLRHCVKPGITGWAQLRYPYGANAEDAAEKLTFDLFYVKNHSLRFDALIFLQTVEIVLFGRGAR